MIYTGDVFPAWKGNIFAGGLAGPNCASHDGRHRVVREESYSTAWVACVIRQTDGYIYVAIESRDGSPTAVVRFGSEVGTLKA